MVSLPSPDQAGFNTFNIGTGEGVSIKLFIGLVAESLLLRRGLKVKLNFGDLPYRLQDPMNCVADNTKILDLLGGFPFTHLQTAIDNMIQGLYEH